MLALAGMMAYHLLSVDDPVPKALVHVHTPFLRHVLTDTGTITGLTSARPMLLSAMQHLLLTLPEESLISSALARVRTLHRCSSQLRFAAIGATRSPKEKIPMHVFQ